MRLPIKFLLLLALVSITTLDSFAYVAGGCFGPVDYNNYHTRTSPNFQANYRFNSSMPSYYRSSTRIPYRSSYDNFQYDKWDVTKEVAGGSLVGAGLGWGASRLLGFDSGWGLGLGALFGGIASYNEETQRQRRNAVILPMLASATYTTSGDAGISYETERYDSGGKIPGTRIQSQRYESSNSGIPNS